MNKSDDTISRQDALNCIRWGEGVTDVVGRINALPSADRPTGRWERVPYKRQEHEEVIVDGYSWRCTNCGDARKRNDIDMKYCPNCAAKMMNSPIWDVEDAK